MRNAMNKQQTVNLIIGAAILVLMAMFAYSTYTRNRADKQVVAILRRTERVIVEDSMLRAMVQPRIDSAMVRVTQLETSQKAIKTQNLYLSKRNENLNKQLDSINSVLGLRPDF